MLTTKKGVRAVHVLFLICGAVFLLSGCTEPGPKALLEGERLIKEGKYSEAIPRLQEAAELLPQNAQAWNHLGLAYQYEGDTANALEKYQHALQVNRNLVAARYNLGQLYFAEGQYGNAASEFTIYVTFEPRNGEAWRKLATAQLRHGLQLTGTEKTKWLDSAKRNFETSLQFGQDPQIYNSLGVIEAQRGKARDAVRLFNLALQKQSNYTPAILNLAVVHHGALNDRRVALQRYREYLAYQPRSSNLREIEAAARQIESEFSPPSTVQRQQYVTNIVTQVLAPPASIRTNATLAARDTSVAKPAVTTSTQTNREPKPQAPNTYSGRAATPKESVASKSLPPPVVATTPLEVIALPEDQPVKPAQDVTAPAETAPAIPAPSLVAAENPATVTAPTSTQPSSREATQKTGIIKRLNPKNWFGDKTNAPVPPKSQSVASAQPKPTVLPPKPVVQRYRYISPAAPRAGNRGDAVRFFNEALAAQRQKDTSGALELYRRSAKADPSFFEAHYNLGLVALEKNSLGEALAANEAALAIAPDSANARYNMGFSLQKANYPADAAAEFEKLLSRNPREVRAHLSLANLYSQQLGRPDKAKIHYQKVLELEPQHPQANAIRLWLRDNP